jgi:hypothetical protein
MDSAMTLQETKSIAQHLGLTLHTVRSGTYRGAPLFCDEMEEFRKLHVEYGGR